MLPNKPAHTILTEAKKVMKRTEKRRPTCRYTQTSNMHTEVTTHLTEPCCEEPGGWLV